MTKIFNRNSEKDKRRSLRKNMPPAEALLWSKLKSRQLLGYRFRRQYSVGSYVTDFYCPELKLAVETDGDSHFQKGAVVYDKQRDRFIESFGIQILRFLNTDVYENIDGVLDVIAREARSRAKVLGTPLPAREWAGHTRNRGSRTASPPPAPPYQGGERSRQL